MIKRIFAAMLAAIAVFAFSACKNNKEDLNPAGDNTPLLNEENDVQNNTEADEEEIDYLSDLSKERYDGYNFRILIRKGKLSDQYFEEPPSDVVEEAVYKRNQLVEQMYGITITAQESSKSNTETDALNSILAGDDAYDLIFPHSRSAFTYAVQGAAYNFNDIDSIHLDKPWWSKDITDSCNINGNLYVLDGDISMHRLSYAMCLMFNKRIFDEKGFDYPYESVKNGEWTFDEFAYLVKKGSADLNGDGVLLPGDDQFGFYGVEWGSPINILYTGGQKIYDKNDDGILEISLYSNKTVDIFEEYFNLMNNEASFLHLTNNPKNYSGGQNSIFTEGRAMMADSNLGNAKLFRNMDDDFGIVPYPKFDEGDDYATTVDAHAHLMIVPITVTDVERTGAIIEALCAIGSRDVVPAFYEVSLKTKYSRDEASEEMMDLIKDSIVYDIGYTCGGPYANTGRELARLNSADFASFYATYSSVAEVALDNFNEDYGGITK